MSHDKPLNESERQHYEKAIGKLQQASSLEKGLIWIITIVALAILFVSVQSARKSAHEAELAQKRNQELLQQIKDSNAEINKHLNCIVVFFTRSDREQLSIQDIDACVIKDGQVVIPNPSTRPDVDVQVTPSGPEAQNQPSEGQTQSSQPQNPSEPAQPEQPQERPPREILGIPVCVPLTDICVRR